MVRIQRSAISASLLASTPLTRNAAQSASISRPGGKTTARNDFRAAITGAAANGSGTAASQTGAPAGATDSGAAATGSVDSGTPDWRVLFSSAPLTPTASIVSTETPAPTAESVFGSNPWLINPTGTGPNSTLFSYNPYYFATQQTADKVAQMVGGTVVQSSQFTPNGGPFAQSQPNNMVQLADGRLINPGLVASFYTHGYPQSYIDQMIANEIQNT
jgi:hypothetical protein